VAHPTKILGGLWPILPTLLRPHAHLVLHLVVVVAVVLVGVTVFKKPKAPSFQFRSG